ncbi:zinc dependent phospholipase C family protein [Guggenheimella bovis]
MPDIWTHYFFAKEMKLELRLKELHDSAYYLGSQGPDLFFYLALKPWKEESQYQKAGSDFHQENTYALLEYVKNDLREQEDPLLRSYLLGFLAHYALDSSTHPLIFSETTDFPSHKRLEANIDVAMHGLRRGRSIQKEFPHRLISIDRGLPECISSWYERAYKAVYEKELPKKAVDLAYRNFIQYLKLTRVGAPPKKLFLKVVSSLSKKDISHYFYPKAQDKTVLTDELFDDFLEDYARGKELFKMILSNDHLCYVRNFEGELTFREEECECEY